MEGQAVDLLPNVLSRLAQGDYFVTKHAQLRMGQRTVSHKDIQRCARTGSASRQPDGKIRVSGKDCDDDDLTLICAEDDGALLVVTVF